MKKSFYFLFVGVLLLVLFISGFFVYFYTVNLLTDQIKQQGLQDIQQIYSDIQQTPSKPDFQAIVRKQKHIIPAHIIIVDERFSVLADSHKRAETVSGKYITAGLSDARHHPFCARTIRSNRKGEFFISISQLKQTSSGAVIIQLVFREKNSKKLSYVFILFAASASAVIAGIVYLLVSVSLKRYRKPIHSLLQHTKNAAGGVYSKISIETNSSELTQLVTNFNTLVDRYNLLIELDNKKYSRINTLLSNMKAGILMVDTENTITLVNPQAEKLLELDKSKLFKDRDEASCQKELVREILAETEKVQNEDMHKTITRMTRKGVILDISIQVIFNKYEPYERSGALVIIQDVTEMRKLEKLKDEFISNVSHEFRTPLTVISGFTETLHSWEMLNKEDRNTAINIIDVETERLKKLISELMILSHIEGEMGGIHKSSINPAAVMKEVMHALEPICSKKRQVVTLNVQGKRQEFHGMATWFRQILFNLYDNAIKYTPPGGTIDISIIQKTDSLIIDIADSGPGIPPAERKRIFERFYRIDKSRGSRIPGNGLGLSLTQRMVEEFNGTIEVLENEWKGALFRVVIPTEQSRKEL